MHAQTQTMRVNASNVQSCPFNEGIQQWSPGHCNRGTTGETMYALLRRQLLALCATKPVGELNDATFCIFITAAYLSSSQKQFIWIGWGFSHCLPCCTWALVHAASR